MKIDFLNPKNGGGWKIMFLSKLVIYRFQPLIGGREGLVAVG